MPFLELCRRLYPSISRPSKLWFGKYIKSS